MKLWSFIDQLFYDNTIEEEYYKKLRQKSSSNSAFIVGLVAAVGGFMYGYDTGLINDLLEMKYVYTHFPGNSQNFSTHERAITVGSLSLGTFIGALIAPLTSDNYGRKFSIIMSGGIIFNIGCILQICSVELALLCVGRLVVGIAVGILSAIVPLYQAEASPKWLRGSVVFTYQWAITWGFLIASAICQGTRRMNNSGSYRIPIGMQFLWSSILVGGMLCLPESPRFYAQKNNLPRALDALAKLRRLPQDDDDLIEELVEIKANYDYELSFGRTKIWDCFKSGGGRHKQGLRMLTGMGVQFFQQCSGVNFIFYYGVNFFSSAGVKSSYIMSLVTYVVNVVFTIPGIILIDTVGRRPLLFWGGIGMACSNFIIAIAGVSVQERQTNAILCVSFACVFITFFASTWGGCTWALCSDIYSISIRQKAVSLTAATNWLVNFIFAFITPYLIDTGAHTAALGSKIFFMWGGLNVLGTLFVYFTVYETKGLKLEEVDYMYAHCTNPRTSTKFKSTKIQYDQMDENYNLIANSQPASTTSNDASNEKDIHDTSTHEHSDSTQANGINNNEALFVVDSARSSIESGVDVDAEGPYLDGAGFIGTTTSASASTSAKGNTNTNTNANANANANSSITRKSRKFSFGSNIASINSSKTVPQPTTSSQPNNDYQIYLESLKKQYSQHYINSASIIRKISSERSGTTSNSHHMQVPQDAYFIDDGPDFVQVDDLQHGVEMNENIPTTIIAAPFYNQPPSDSDSDSDSDSNSNSDSDSNSDSNLNPNSNLDLDPGSQPGI
ncbi:Plasma membrane low glucose sensor [Lodderomyces elongisporus]|uniref:Plasma membrane low glucose sensor n=1 Tax=Lodderomyces elongisporus TaxID=36914 RepID=UPI00291CB853|nr:Plasma membrane low glucose sensor [Lodderomyces elongisporus]WLF79924.1 Plasma membrane low glucose sensor [Lodderomyces elongisporus]